MRASWAAFFMMMSLLPPGMAMAQPGARAETPTSQGTSAPCTQDANVDSCWRAGVSAERRGDARGALAAYEASCAAGFQMGGCYEAGKIHFLNPGLRDYAAAKDRMTRVCDSADVGIGPYGCTYLGIIYRKGLAGGVRIDRAFAVLSRSCFQHNSLPSIDGKGCEILADSIPDADEMGVADEIWQPAYIAYLALAMGCSDAMPALCAKAQALHDRAVTEKARWLARCAEDVEAVGLSGGCGDLPRAARVTAYEQRQQFRRGMVRLFSRVTEYAG